LPFAGIVGICCSRSRVSIVICYFFLTPFKNVLT
jgi:hypothetical protein